MKSLITIIGALAFVAGVFFTLQGLGIIQYPASSFMVDNSSWVYKGAIIAAVGLLAIVLVRRSGGVSQ
jgi:membrane protein implicated in regulation of membrane protease activity